MPRLFFTHTSHDVIQDQMAPVGNPIRQEILVPFSETSDSFMVLLHGVLSTEECKAIIAASEVSPFSPENLATARCGELPFLLES